MADLEEILARLIEKVESRYFGKYRGEVVDNEDPDDLGRIKAKVPRLTHNEEIGWALPAFPYGGKAEQGFFAVPDVGASVWIEFAEGDLSYPIWTGTWYGDGEIPEFADFNKKVWKTSTGHKIVLDDDEKTLEITDANDNTVFMEQSTIKINAGSATKIIVNAPQIELIENATHPLAFGDDLLQYLTQLVQMMQTHMHPGELALGIFPVTPMVPSAVFPVPTPALLSKKVNTG
jgi:Type VI secretion system/phage-baseplate injector OB domain